MLDRPTRQFAFLAMFLSFLITGEACVAKAVSNSIFLSEYGAKQQPFAWLVTIPFNLLIVWLYNTFLFRIGCFRMVVISCVLGAVVNVLSGYYMMEYKGLSFFLYIWKDIYIMLMFQQLWGLLHATIQLNKAKFLYGLIFGVGGLGSVLASLIPGFFAIRFGSEHLLYLTVPFLFFIVIGYHFAMKVRLQIGTSQSLDSSHTQNLEGGLSLIKNSRLLQFILWIVASMQIILTLLDFNFSTMVQEHIPDTDQKTEFLGRFFGLINFINLFLQFVGTFTLLDWIGLKRSHLFVPSVFIISLSALCLFPTFPVMLVTFGVAKSMDYSVFAIIKEMLYIPLKVEEKFKAKAIIDVFVYRSAKAVASCLLLIVGFAYANFLSILLAALWLFSVMVLLWKFPGYQSLEEKSRF